LLSSCGLSNFTYTPTQVLTMMNNAIINLTPEPTASQFAAANESGNCPLNNSPLRPADDVNPISLEAFPNPFSSTTTVQFMLNTSTDKAEVEVFNATGSKIATLFSGAVTEGEIYNLSFAIDNVANGIYYVRINAGENTQHLKLMLMKQ
jgi:hypothetical protein